MDIFTFEDMLTAMQNAQAGDVLIFNIMNNIIFTNVLVFNKTLNITLINSSGNENITLSIASGGAFRHFSSGVVAINNIELTIEAGIILDGGTTGGGIQFFGSDSLITLNNCTINNCKSTTNGGGLLIQGNTTKSRLVMNNTLIENCQAINGGGIFASAYDIEMNEGQIINNHANTGGGGISTSGGANRLGSTLTINGGKINNNSTLPAGDSGGINAFDTIVTITNGEVSFNAADGSGGGIFSFNQSGENLNALVITNSSIIGNTIRNFGGGIRVENALSEFTITNSIITNNKAVSTTVGSNQGGGVYLAGGTLTVIDSTISNNEAGTSGGGIFSNLATLIIRNTEISENVAQLTAGGVYGYQGANITIEENTRIINNQALSGGDPENSARGGGGIVILAFGFVSTLNISNSTISGNTSVSYGGGIWTYPGFGPENFVNIENSVIENNTANYGGGISMGAISGFIPALTVTDSTINNNSAIKDGGGIIALGSTVNINESEIINNKAGRNGGGIFTDNLANVTVDASSSFSGNTAATYTFWTVTSGGDSDIHKTHIFTDQFSSFIPVQTQPPLTFLFTNAYNNYDINYVKEPLKTITINLVDDNNPTHILHTITIDSFLGATVTITPVSIFLESNGVRWILEPSDQPAQTVELSDPNIDYIITFTYGEIESSILSPTSVLMIIKIGELPDNN